MWGRWGSDRSPDFSCHKAINGQSQDSKPGLMTPNPCSCHCASINCKLALAIGTCHLLLYGLYHVLFQLLTSNILWKAFRVESRNEALCAQGKTSRVSLQLVRYFHELILWAQFLFLFISRKHRNPSCWWLFLITSKSFTRLAETFGIICTWLYAFPLHQNHKYTDFLPCLFGTVSQSDLRCCLPGSSPHFAPNKT